MSTARPVLSLMSDYRAKAVSIFSESSWRGTFTFRSFFITGYGDIPMSVRAIKGGAIEFLTKPFRDQDLLEAVQQGLVRYRAWRENIRATAAATLRARLGTLTRREQEASSWWSLSL